MSINTRSILYRSLEYSVTGTSNSFKLFTASGIYRVGCTIILSDKTSFYIEVDNNHKAMLRNVSRPATGFIDFSGSKLQYSTLNNIDTIYLYLGANSSEGIIVKTDIIIGTIGTDLPAATSIPENSTDIIKLDFTCTDTIMSLSNTSIKSDNINSQNITATTISVPNSITVNGDISVNTFNFNNTTNDKNVVNLGGGFSFGNVDKEKVTGVLLNPYESPTNDMELSGKTIVFPNNVDLLAVKSDANTTILSIKKGEAVKATLKTGPDEETKSNFVFSYNFDEDNIETDKEITYNYNSGIWYNENGQVKTIKIPNIKDNGAEYTLAIEDSMKTKYFTDICSIIRILIPGFNQGEQNESYLVTTKALNILVGSSEYSTTSGGVGNLNKGTCFTTSNSSIYTNALLYQSGASVTSLLANPLESNQVLMHNDSMPTWGNLPVSMSSNNEQVTVTVGNTTSDGFTVPYATKSNTITVNKSEEEPGQTMSNLNVLLSNSDNKVYSSDKIKFNASTGSLTLSGNIKINKNTVLSCVTSGTLGEEIIDGSSSTTFTVVTDVSQSSYALNVQKTPFKLPGVKVTTNTSTPPALDYGGTFEVISDVSNKPGGHTLTIAKKTYTIPSAATGAVPNDGKLYLVGALHQNEVETTYSNSSVYIQNNELYSNNKLVLTEHQSLQGVRDEITAGVSNVKTAVKSAFKLTNGVLTIDLSQLN